MSIEFVFSQLMLGAEAGLLVGSWPGAPATPLCGLTEGARVRWCSVRSSLWQVDPLLLVLLGLEVDPLPWVLHCLEVPIPASEKPATLSVLYIISVHVLVFFTWCTYMFSLLVMLQTTS